MALAAFAERRKIPGPERIAQRVAPATLAVIGIVAVLFPAKEAES